MLLTRTVLKANTGFQEKANKTRRLVCSLFDIMDWEGGQKVLEEPLA